MGTRGGIIKKNVALMLGSGKGSIAYVLQGQTIRRETDIRLAYKGSGEIVAFLKKDTSWRKVKVPRGCLTGYMFQEFNGIGRPGKIVDFISLKPTAFMPVIAREIIEESIQRYNEGNFIQEAIKEQQQNLANTIEQQIIEKNVEEITEGTKWIALYGRPFQGRYLFFDYHPKTGVIGNVRTHEEGMEVGDKSLHESEAVDRLGIRRITLHKWGIIKKIGKWAQGMKTGAIELNQTDGKIMRIVALKPAVETQEITRMFERIKRRYNEEREKQLVKARQKK